MNPRHGAAFVLAALTAALAPAPARALDSKLDLSVQSAYIWRGMVITDKPVLQPSLTLFEGGLAGSIWANVNLTGDHGYQYEVSEADYWLAYTFAGNNADWTLTYYAYTFPHTTVASTQEVWANVTLKNLPFSPSLSAIRDVNVVKGWYFLLTGSQSLGVLKTRGTDGLVLTLNVGHGNKEYCRGYLPEIEHDSVTDWGVRLDWPVKVGPGTLKLDVQYADFTDQDVYAAGFEDTHGNLFGGLVYTLMF